MARWRRIERIGNKLVRFGKQTIHGFKTAKNIVARVPVYEKIESTVEYRYWSEFPEMKATFTATEDVVARLVKAASSKEDYYFSRVESSDEATWRFSSSSKDVGYAYATAHFNAYGISKRYGNEVWLAGIDAYAFKYLDGKLELTGCTASASPSITVEKLPHVEYEPIDDKDFEGALK